MSIGSISGSSVAYQPLQPSASAQPAAGSQQIGAQDPQAVRGHGHHHHHHSEVSQAGSSSSSSGSVTSSGTLASGDTAASDDTATLLNALV